MARSYPARSLGRSTYRRPAFRVWARRHRLPLTLPTTDVVVGSQASEIDTANAGTPVIVVAGTQAVETDTAQAGTPAIAVPGTQATETDVGNAGAVIVVYVGAQASETDTANAGSIGSTLVVGSQASEADTANAGVAESRPETTTARVLELTDVGTLLVASLTSPPLDVDVTSGGLSITLTL